MKKSIQRYAALIMVALAMSVSLTGCDDDDDYYADLDRWLFGTWVENSASFNAGYITFYPDGTGEQGYYDGGLYTPDIAFDWYTVDDTYVYINGVEYWYAINGYTLTVSGPGGTWYYTAAD